LAAFQEYYSCVPDPIRAGAEPCHALARGAQYHGDKQLRAILSDWPLQRPADWVRLVNEPMTEKEAQRVRTCIARNRPFGSKEWQDEQAKRLGLLHTLRSEGRPMAIGGERRVKN
jgi:hypothetical protein